MPDMKKVIKGLEICSEHGSWHGLDCELNEAYKDCPYRGCETGCIVTIAKDALQLLKEQEKEIKALHLLVEWAEECDFGFDQFPDEYERYKDEIKDMKYIDGMVYIAKRTLEDQGAFEEGW